MNKKELEDLLISDDTDFVERIKQNKKEIFEFIPELKAEENFQQNNKWHIYDVWNHTLVALKNSPNDLDIRLALLLHDIGKPFSYQDDESGRHFKNHALKSNEISKKILLRLGYNEEKVEELCFYIKNHSTHIDLSKVNATNYKKYEKLLIIQYCDCSAYNPKYIRKGMGKLDVIKDDLINKKKLFDESII